MIYSNKIACLFATGTLMTITGYFIHEKATLGTGLGLMISSLSAIEHIDYNLENNDCRESMREFSKREKLLNKVR